MLAPGRAALGRTVVSTRGDHVESSGWIGLAILVTFVVMGLSVTIRRRMTNLARPEDRASIAALADVEQHRAQHASTWAGAGGGGADPV